MMKKSNFFKNKLWTKFFAIFAVLLLAFSVSMTYMWNRQFVKTMREEKETQFINASRDANRQTEEKLSSTKVSIENAINSANCIKNLKTLNDKESYNYVYKTLDNLFTARSDELDGLIYVGKNHTSVGIGTSYTESLISDPFVSEFFANSYYSDSSSKSYVHFNTTDMKLYIPVYSINECIGIIIADINQNVLTDAFSGQMSLNNSVSMVFNEEYDLIFSNSSNFNSQTIDKEKQSIKNLFDNIKYSGEFYTLNFSIMGNEYFGMAYRSSYTGLTSVIFTPLSDINASYFKSPTFIMLIVSSILFFVLALIMCILLVKNIVLKIEKLKNNMISYTEKIESPELRNTEGIIIKDEIDECHAAYTEMLNHIRNQIESIEKLNEQRRVFEINALEAQLNPHFLYNTLNTISFLANTGNTKGVSKLSVALIDLLQFTLRNKTPYVTVQEEMTYIRNYISINTQNSENPLEVQYLIPDEIMDVKIPKMLLQPILENCFKHGLCGNENDLIVIKAAIEKNELELKVIDNGKGISPEQLKKLSHLLNSPDIPSDKIGLCNINKRLKVMYGEKYGLSIFSIENMQTIVTVRLPITDDKGEL